MDKSNKKAIEILLDRFKEAGEKVYCQIFAVDDKKKDKKIHSNFFNVKENPYNKIIEEAEIHNIGSLGVFTNINPLNSDKRIKANVIKIQNIFIDLDHANEKDYLLVKDYLNKISIKYWYSCQSGGGYHFLIPVDFESEQENKVKGFLTYLHNNVCDKVDIATFTNERLIRFPESIHNKKDLGFELKTLDVFEPTEEIIKNNNEIVLDLQQEQNKGTKDIAYTNNIKRDDVFFSTILSNNKNWPKYYACLNNSERRNDVFVKNMGFYFKNSSDDNSLTAAKFFYDGWEPTRFDAMHGWKKKAECDNMNINYLELLSWAKQNKSQEFIELLEEQLRETFLDDYEIYYLEEEKTENNCILYYPLKNYYVQKSIQEVILNIYYDCKEKGTDLTEELKLKDLYDKWAEFNFKKQMALTQDQIRRILETENRIKMIYNINYKPCDDKFILQDGKKYFNIYNKGYLFDYFKKQDKYHFPHIHELISNLCGEEEKGTEYLYKWLAHIMQNPLEKLPTAIILQGAQGSGKGTFKNYVLDKIFGSFNVQEINQSHLESSFNEYLLGKQIIVANEVMHNENRQTLPNILKNLVTDPQITINRKFRKEIVGVNYTHWIFCTNSDNPIKIDEDDRRYTVFYSKKLKGGGKAAAKFIEDLRENLDYEIKEFISFLKELPVKFSEVHEPYMTEAKEAIIDLNRDSLNRFIEYIKQYDNLLECHLKLFGNPHIHYLVDSSGENCLLGDEFYKLYYKWAKESGEYGIFSKQKFSRNLTKFNIKNDVKKINNKPLRVFDVQEIENILLS